MLPSRGDVVGGPVVEPHGVPEVSQGDAARLLLHPPPRGDVVGGPVAEPHGGPEEGQGDAALLAFHLLRRVHHHDSIITRCTIDYVRVI